VENSSVKLIVARVVAAGTVMGAKPSTGVASMRAIWMSKERRLRGVVSMKCAMLHFEKHN